jgi:hypothetical protein
MCEQGSTTNGSRTMTNETPFMIFWRGMIQMARAHNLPEPTFGPARREFAAASEDMQRERIARLCQRLAA